MACKDRTVKVLDGTTTKVKSLLHLEGIPTCLALYDRDGGERGQEILVGTSDGRFCLVTVNTGAEDATLIRWTYESETNAGVTCMDFFDLNGDGVRELIVGFDDGTAQIYQMDPEEYLMLPPRLLFSQVYYSEIPHLF